MLLSRQAVTGFVLGVFATAAVWRFGSGAAPGGSIALAQNTEPERGIQGESQPPLRMGNQPSAQIGPGGTPFNPQGLGPGAVPIPGGIPAPTAAPGPEAFWNMPAGDPQKGKAAMEKYGCGGCHEIDGVPGARGKVGPPLTGVGGRVYIGGVLRNNRANIVRWIQNPQAFVPNVDMPNLGVTSEDAQNIAAYLGTLR
jgi:cytochrome c2